MIFATVDIEIIIGVFRFVGLAGREAASNYNSVKLVSHLVGLIFCHQILVTSMYQFFFISWSIAVESTLQKKSDNFFIV